MRAKFICVIRNVGGLILKSVFRDRVERNVNMKEMLTGIVSDMRYMRYI